MFGIGLPELILILAIGLIVLGPDKLPELARSLAKGIGELKRSLATIKEDIDKETAPWKESIRSDLSLDDRHDAGSPPVNESHDDTTDDTSAHILPSESAHQEGTPSVFFSGDASSNIESDAVNKTPSNPVAPKDT